ncbi:hypothetical protein EWM64_g5636 [Hericium alpestre]|uniref:Protein kinase domain-containing protein n=1 Tax=Hericium alpestre TaxID=135208 RepID=A0A4Y9ZW32_9AGAM|nr:hypothetical protein EWM64_g5636 [Hericium alpestre]
MLIFLLISPYYAHLVQVYSIFALCCGSGTCASLVVVINNSPALFLQTNNANDEVADTLLLLTCVLALHRRAPQLLDAQGECLNVMHSKLSFVNPNVGYPLTQFCDLVELLGAFRDAIESHKHLYNKGLLHRDVNPTKILLTGDMRPKNRSFIVDFDDAVCTKDRKAFCSGKQIVRASS